MEPRSKSDRTKIMLANSLKSLICEQKFERISIENICSRANVTRRSFYHHFMDKYDLLNWIYDQDFIFDFAEHPEWTFGDYFPLFCERIYTEKEFYLRAYQISGQNGFREHCYDWLYPLLHRDFKDCFLSEEQEAMFLRAQTYITFDNFIHWLQSKPCPPPEVFLDTFLGTYMKYCKKMIEIFERPESRR